MVRTGFVWVQLGLSQVSIPLTPLGMARTGLDWVELGMSHASNPPTPTSGVHASNGCTVIPDLGGPCWEKVPDCCYRKKCAENKLALVHFVRPDLLPLGCSFLSWNDKKWI